MASSDTREPLPTPQRAEFSAAEIGALAHLYRGEVYRSTVWRTRLDSSTNWAVVTTGIALSATYSSAEASPLPLVLVGLLVQCLPFIRGPPLPDISTSRRARAFARDRFLRAHDPGRRRGPDLSWTELLALDYVDPRYHISFARAVGQ